jgi:hypothetical protein
MVLLLDFPKCDDSHIHLDFVILYGSTEGKINDISNSSKDYALNHLLICRAKTGHKRLRSEVRNSCQKYI